MAFAANDVTIADQSINQPDGGRMANPKGLAKVFDRAAAQELMERHQRCRRLTPATSHLFGGLADAIRQGEGKRRNDVTKG